MEVGNFGFAIQLKLFIELGFNHEQILMLRFEDLKFDGVD
jgi:hypothetical protein